MTDSPASYEPHLAADAMTGYLFQARYALLRALHESRRNPRYRLSIEKFDDVAFEDGHPIELIQTKHHGKRGNTSDRSVDIWKTLHVWIKQVRDDPSAVADTRFVLLTTNTASPGSALSKLRAAEDRNETQAIELLLSAATTSTNHATKPARDSFLALDNSTRKLLAQNIWVFDNAPDIIDVRNEIEDILHYTVPANKMDAFMAYLEGWWFNRVVTALTDPSSSTISLTSIQNKVFEIQESFKSDNLPLDDTIDAMSPLTTSPHDNRVFVRQMNLVGVSQREVFMATHDYYRASGQRSRWARENLLLDGETDRYDRALWDAWRRQFLAAVADANDDADDSVTQAVGKSVFRWACRHQKPLRNRDEIWLSSGSFQILSDAIRVGWHPQYESLLGSKGQ